MSTQPHPDWHRSVEDALQRVDARDYRNVAQDLSVLALEIRRLRGDEDVAQFVTRYVPGRIRPAVVETVVESPEDDIERARR